jgi:hypothetical protein
MIYLKTSLFAIFLSFVCLYVRPSVAQPVDNVLVELVSLDPGAESNLGSDDRLYVLVRYESAIPLRFQAIAMREGTPLEVGAIRNPAALHAQGNGEALAWVGYTNPTHIDAVSVVVLNEEWQELYRLSEKADVRWQGVAAPKPRELAGWVNALIKSEKRTMDFVYDPAPQKHGTLFGIIFFLTIASFPAYILLQFRMLWRYKYRWRELAAIPLFPYMILAFYYVAGLDIETSLQVTFLARYTPLALLYLVALWLAKQYWQNKLPPPKLYKSLKS